MLINLDPKKHLIDDRHEPYLNYEARGFKSPRIKKYMENGTNGIFCCCMVRSPKNLNGMEWRLCMCANASVAVQVAMSTIILEKRCTSWFALPHASCFLSLCLSSWHWGQGVLVFPNDSTYKHINFLSSAFYPSNDRPAHKRTGDPLLSSDIVQEEEEKGINAPSASPKPFHRAA